MSKFSFTSTSTSLVISSVALIVSLLAFTVLYNNKDLFWPVVWLLSVLPAIWLAALIFTLRDVVKRRSWAQAIGVLVLLAPTVLLVTTTFSSRFAFHQLFTFRPLDLQLPDSGIVLMEKFPVCKQGSHCSTQTQTFKVRDIPTGCCTLSIRNGDYGKHKVERFRIILNGNTVKLPSDNSPTVAFVELNHDNTLNVDLNGDADAYIYVILTYKGKQNPRAIQSSSASLN